MAAGNCFDQWQNDVFFSAAEEIQESADKMESVYRLWMKERSERLISDISGELGRELHMALGTAKWQLEELERAVKLSHERSTSEENTIARHGQFVDAIGSQISRVEKALLDSFIHEGKQPLRWVQLDEEDRDDLAVFLSIAPDTSQEPDDQCANDDVDSSQAGEFSNSMNGYKETAILNEDRKHVVELRTKKHSKTKNEVDSQTELINGQRRTWSSPDIGAWKVVTSNEEDVEKKALETRTETSEHAFNLSGILRNAKFVKKPTWLRNSFRKAKSGEYLQKRGASSYHHLKGITRFAKGVNMLNERSKSYNGNHKEDSKVSYAQQLFVRVVGFQQKTQNPQYYMRFSRSIRFTFLFMISILLIVPFVFYSA